MFMFMFGTVSWNCFNVCACVFDLGEKEGFLQIVFSLLVSSWTPMALYKLVPIHVCS